MQYLCGFIIWDHPRVCGEQSMINAGIRDGDGSPPRVRGTVTPLIWMALAIRITPACAGNRKKETSRVLLFGDHPRVCGEQYLMLMQKNCR